VSPTYAREIQGEEQGCGLDGVLRERAKDLSGILNGVDPKVWSPATDAGIAERYSATAMAGKAACRARLQAEFALAPQQKAPLFGIVSRLTDQKGFNLVLAGLDELLGRGAQLVVLGSGDPALEAELRAAAAAHPAQVALRLGYDEALAHRIVAGADVILVPSRFEPCGLDPALSGCATAPCRWCAGSAVSPTASSTARSRTSPTARRPASCSSASTSATTALPCAAPACCMHAPASGVACKPRRWVRISTGTQRPRYAALYRAVIV
jgi:hypothetical protein